MLTQPPTGTSVPEESTILASGSNGPGGVATGAPGAMATREIQIVCLKSANWMQQQLGLPGALVENTHSRTVPSDDRLSADTHTRRTDDKRDDIARGRSGGKSVERPVCQLVRRMRPCPLSAA